MTSLRRITRVLGCIALLAACGEATGPGLRGRWAAKGIELTVRPLTTELRLPCGIAGLVLRPISPDAAGNIQFSTRVTVHGTSYSVDFVGQFRSDTLAAMLTVAAGMPWVETFAMLPDADSQFGSFVCLID